MIDRSRSAVDARRRTFEERIGYIFSFYGGWVSPKQIRMRLRTAFEDVWHMYGSRIYARRIWNETIRRKIGRKQRDMVDGRQLSLFP